MIKMDIIKTPLRPAGRYGGCKIYIDSGMISDSKFPFKKGEILTVQIDEDRLIILSSKQSKE